MPRAQCVKYFILDTAGTDSILQGLPSSKGQEATPKVSRLTLVSPNHGLKQHRFLLKSDQRKVGMKQIGAYCRIHLAQESSADRRFFFFFPSSFSPLFSFLLSSFAPEYVVSFLCSFPFPLKRKREKRKAIIWFGHTGY
ncbi:hypothetical protein BDV28DRAFT_133286, partial [Aspergillus coremiiformis]